MNKRNIKQHHDSFGKCNNETLLFFVLKASDPLSFDRISWHVWLDSFFFFFFFFLEEPFGLSKPIMGVIKENTMDLNIITNNHHL